MRRAASDKLHDPVLRRDGDHIGDITPSAVEQARRDVVLLPDRADFCAVFTAHMPDDFDVTGLLGGLLGLFALLPICPDFAGMRRRTATGASEIVANRPHPTVVPYGVAIAAAALIATLPPYFS